MTTYLILAQSTVTAAALESIVRAQNEVSQPQVLWNRDWNGRHQVDMYELLVREIERVASSDSDAADCRNLVMLVDSVQHKKLSAIGDGLGNWHSLIAMLILTFPEVHWMFGVVLDDFPEKHIGADHRLGKLFDVPRREYLLDPSGLRNLVRKITNNKLKETPDSYELPLRNNRSAAIDDEKAYAYLHAYTAYRFGYKGEVVTSSRLMHACFGETGQQDDTPHNYQILFEDMSLSFADRETSEHVISLKDRGEKFPKLDSAKPNVENSNYRWLVTTGQTAQGEETLLQKNLDYLHSHKPPHKPRRSGIIFKPTSGMFDLWRKAGLGGKLAPDFFLPPRVRSDSDKATSAHGAPGKLALVSETLIDRAERLLSKAASVRNAVFGAVLANDATELLGTRIPTLGIEALRLKHRFEVIAECQFSGVEYHIPLRERLAEITRDVAATCEWFGRRQRVSAALNAEMVILSDLVRVFREFGQFDEEQHCVHRTRRLHNTLWMSESSMRKLLWPALRYIEILLSSFSVFVVILVGWLVILGLLYWGAGYEGGSSWSFACGLQDSISSFFSIGPPTLPNETICKANNGWGYALVTSAAIFLGFVHLGVFISHLYSITARR